MTHPVLPLPQLIKHSSFKLNCTRVEDTGKWDFSLNTKGICQIRLIHTEKAGFETGRTANEREGNRRPLPTKAFTAEEGVSLVFKTSRERNLRCCLNFLFSLFKRHLTKQLLCSFSQPMLPFETPIPMAFGEKILSLPKEDWRDGFLVHFLIHSIQ